MSRAGILLIFKDNLNYFRDILGFSGNTIANYAGISIVGGYGSAA